MLTQTRIDTQIEKARSELATLEAEFERLEKLRERETDKATRLANEVRWNAESMRQIVDVSVPEARKPSRTFQSMHAKIASANAAFEEAYKAVNGYTKAIDKTVTHIDRINARIAELEKRRNRVPA